MKSRCAPLIAVSASLALFACKKTEKTESSKSPIKAAANEAPKGPNYGRVDRMKFNRVAAELALPVYWVEDKNKDKTIQAAELATLWGITDDTSGWTDGGKLSAKFEKAYNQVAQIANDGHTDIKLSAPEKKRRTLVRQELSQGRPTVVLSDFTSGSEEDKAIVKHIMAASKTIEKLFARQTGTLGMASKIPADDTASKMMFYRNQGPWCSAPATESNPDCSALADKPKKISGLYPADVQADPKFCDALAKGKKELLGDHFSVVKGKKGDLSITPYTVEYKDDMEAVAKSLEAAAGAIKSKDEEAFKTYLTAAAKAFRTNDWDPANEAWSKMNVHNSKWYLRIAPDEVYFEPCSVKAGFHVSFGRINVGSLEWQKKLDPVKGEMEQAIAKLAGAPYKAREVSFHLPDFVDIVINAGDSRSPMGATIGQSLPNWGPVANEGRGRTVAMTNFYTDADSKSAMRAQVQSLLCASSMKAYTSDPSPQIMSTVLHEAAHNLGPAHEYKVNGKVDDEVFGGPLASTLEELKAQTAALYYTDWLVTKKLITKEMADKAHTRDITWAFGHISRGMYSSTNKPKPYSQLAAIQLGFLMKEGAIAWNAEAKAANGTDMGCFDFKLDQFPKAIEKLATEVAGIKSRGDKKKAEGFIAAFVDDKEQKKVLDRIAERWLRSAKASFVYAIKL